MGRVDLFIVHLLNRYLWGRIGSHRARSPVEYNVPFIPHIRGGFIVSLYNEFSVLWVRDYTRFISGIVSGGGVILEIPIFSLNFSSFDTEDVSIVLFLRLGFDLLGFFPGFSFLCETFALGVSNALPAFYIYAILACFAGVHLFPCCFYCCFRPFCLRGTY